MTDLEIATLRTWAEIDLDELAHNIKILRKKLNPDSKFLGVCKANAYGHGIFECAKTLQKFGADWLAVAAVTSGVNLRKNGITLPILCLGQTQPEFADLMSDYRITQAVGELENGLKLSKIAKETGKKIKIKKKNF